MRVRACLLMNLARKFKAGYSAIVKGSKLIEVGIDTFRKPENGEQRRDMLLVLMSVLL